MMIMMIPTIMTVIMIARANYLREKVNTSVLVDLMLRYENSGAVKYMYSNYIELTRWGWTYFRTLSMRSSSTEDSV